MNHHPLVDEDYNPRKIGEAELDAIEAGSNVTYTERKLVEEIRYLRDELEHQYECSKAWKRAFHATWRACNPAGPRFRDVHGWGKILKQLTGFRKKARRLEKDEEPIP